MLFGATYGYDNEGNPSFITLLGEPDTSTSTLDYTGSDFETRTDGFAFPATRVGDFTWTVNIERGQPAATLEISNSPVLRGELDLVRLSFNEIDAIDAISESDWIGFFNTSGQLFAHQYSFGTRTMNNGIPFLPVTQQARDPGVISHAENGVYGLLAPFSGGGTGNGGIDIFYSCNGTPTQLYCLLWLLALGQTPADFAGSPAGLVSTRIQLNRSLTKKTIATDERLRRLQLELYQSELANLEETGLFDTKDIMIAYRLAVAIRDQQVNP